MLEITRMIYSNSESSEHFLVCTECFFDLFLEVSKIYLEQLEFKLEKNIGILET